MAGATVERLVSVRALIAEDAIRAVYQPIVELERGSTVAYEALVRGPAGSGLEMPGELFGAAAREGVLAQLDIAAARTAVRGATGADWPGGAALFVNVEPSSLVGARRPLDEEVDELGVNLVVELTERELAAAPAEVLRAAARIRSRGWGIALDDLGADRRSLALLPFVAPGVMKIDRALVQGRTTRSVAHVVNALAAEAERSGAVLLAEGIETEEHVTRARAFGALLGQGWYFGRPAELPVPTPARMEPLRLGRGSTPAAEGTPFGVVSESLGPRVGDKRLLLALSRQLEAEAENLGGEAVVLATFQEASFFTPATRERYSALARSSALVGALGVGMSEDPAPSVRGGRIAPDDPLRGEWDVVVVSPHFAGAFVARDLGDRGPDLDRRFEFCLSYDREIVLRAARILLDRVVPAFPR